MSNLPGGEGRAATGIGPEKGGGEVGDPMEENGGEREEVAPVAVLLTQEEKIIGVGKNGGLQGPRRRTADEIGRGRVERSGS